MWRTDTTDGPSGNVEVLQIGIFVFFWGCLKAFRSFWEGAFVACGFSFFPSSFLFLGSDFPRLPKTCSAFAIFSSSFRLWCVDAPEAAIFLFL